MWSVWSVASVQALNAFGDNLVKMLIIGLAMAISADSAIAKEMQVYLALVFSLPYIAFAPMAGFLSDRFSKKRVIVWTQVVQLFCYIGFIFALRLRAGEYSLWACLLLFFGLAVQAAIFSPAKTGILKELVGSRGLGKASGLMQMAMMLGILAGIGAGGAIYKQLRDRGFDAWDAAAYPVCGCTVLAVLQIIAAVVIRPTKGSPEVRYSHSLWWQHTQHLGAVFSDRAIGLAVSGMVFFWFMSYSVGTIMVGLGKEMFPGNDASATAEVSLMSAMIGLGVMAGGLLGAMVCRKRIELGVVPIAGAGIALGLLVACLVPEKGMLLLMSLFVVGLSGGLFLVPLTAFVQDRSPSAERARILSSAHLMDCLIGGVGGNVLVFLMLKLGISSSAQLGVIGAISVVAVIYISRIVTWEMIRFLFGSIIRAFYRVKVNNAEAIPATGGALLLPNHVSYVDALILGACCERQVRFVIWEDFYHVWWMKGFLRLMGTVPISPIHAKDAIRIVTAALKDGELVCLFPEGAITRTGDMGELQKGFELILRKAECPALPVYLHGLWGSIFSYEGGKVFKKWPKSLPYPVAVTFGSLLSPGEATVARVVSELEALRQQSENPTAAT